MTSSLLLLATLLSLTDCLETAMVGPVGYGTLIILVFSLLAFLLLIISRGSDNSEFIAIGGVLLPVSAFLFFWFVPKESDYLSK